MKRRKGFLMIWAIVAITIAFMLGTAAFGLLQAVLRLQQRMEIHLDEVLIAQDDMEQAKYNLRFLENEISFPEEVIRNGRTYRVHVGYRPQEIEEVLMVEITCHVEHSSGVSLEWKQLVEGH